MDFRWIDKICECLWYIIYAGDIFCCNGIQKSKFRRLCRVPWPRHSAKFCHDLIFKIILPSAMTTTLGKVYNSIHTGILFQNFAECKGSTRQSIKEKIKINLPSVQPCTRQNLQEKNKNKFAECWAMHSAKFTLTADSVTAEKLCRVLRDALSKIIGRVPPRKHSANLLRRVRFCRVNFAERHNRQRICRVEKWSLPSVITLGKATSSSSELSRTKVKQVGTSHHKFARRFDMICYFLCLGIKLDLASEYARVMQQNIERETLRFYAMLVSSVLIHLKIWPTWLHVCYFNSYEHGLWVRIIDMIEVALYCGK